MRVTCMLARSCLLARMVVQPPHPIISKVSPPGIVISCCGVAMHAATKKRFARYDAEKDKKVSISSLPRVLVGAYELP